MCYISYFWPSLSFRKVVTGNNYWYIQGLVFRWKTIVQIIYNLVHLSNFESEGQTK